MKLIIDMPEDVYTRLFDNGIQDNEIEVDDVCEMARAIRKGSPLPKGHGRLIDADSIYQIVRPIEQSDAEWGMTAETAIRLMHDVFDKAPTIIEADKTESEVEE